MGIVNSFPKSWRTEVTVIRGGHDQNGDPLPGQTIQVKDCLIGQRSTSEPGASSDVTNTDASLYRDPDPHFRFQSTDQIRVPEGSLNAGLWTIDGKPKETPLGVEVPIKEA